MKKLLSLILTVVIVMSVFAGCSKTTEFTFCPSGEPGDISVVSFNVAAPWGSLTDNTLSSNRVKRFAIYMNAVKPDSIGTQEMNKDWLGKLSELLSDYDSYGVARGGDENEKKSEMNAVFWLKDKYDCIDKNTFWLSETPDKESKYEGAGCYRICSYVVLENKTTKERYIHMNTHLDNASDEARAFGAGVINDQINVLKESYSDVPIVLSGDFNDGVYSTAYQMFANQMYVTNLNTNTYHEWGNIKEGEPIDFIFTEGVIVNSTILDDTTNGFVSDHYGVLANINL